MGRKYIDCREVPSERGCTVAIAADSEQELLEAAIQHAMTVHHEDDSPELRTAIKRAMRDVSHGEATGAVV